MQLGAYIRCYREYYGLTQQQLAKELRMSQAYLSQIETGTRTPKKLRAEVIQKYPPTGDLLLYLKTIGAI